MRTIVVMEIDSLINSRRKRKYIVGQIRKLPNSYGVTMKLGGFRIWPTI